ncbi:MAG: tyrosine-type recombinase/integrase, partial [Enterococcus sp.]|nr:tyrosine-type recombinase/integrase [Enterococcus sp.]
NYLNANTEIISDRLTEKSRTYANIRTLKSYVNSMFDVAEILGYIEFNRTTKVIQSITSPRKIALQEKKEQEGKQALTVNELIEWLEVVQNCLNNQSLSFKDYTLFMLTLYLGDRKSESYALQWRHIDLDNHTIRLKFALNKKKKMKKTKGGKDTIIHTPEILVSLLQKWKELQKIELEKFRIQQTPQQQLLTYMKPYGDVNSPLHSDYLNYRINKIMKYHKHLAHLTPHKLRHTYATLAKQGGADLSKISEALTHSEITTTRIYVNTPDVVNLDVYNAFDSVLKKGILQ